MPFSPNGKWWISRVPTPSSKGAISSPQASAPTATMSVSAGIPALGSPAASGTDSRGPNPCPVALRPSSRGPLSGPRRPTAPRCRCSPTCPLRDHTKAAGSRAILEQTRPAPPSSAAQELRTTNKAPRRQRGARATSASRPPSAVDVRPSTPRRPMSGSEGPFSSSALSSVDEAARAGGRRAHGHSSGPLEETARPGPGRPTEGPLEGGAPLAADGRAPEAGGPGRDAVCHPAAAPGAAGPARRPRPALGPVVGPALPLPVARPAPAPRACAAGHRRATAAAGQGRTSARRAGPPRPRGHGTTGRAAFGSIASWLQSAN